MTGRHRRGTQGLLGLGEIRVALVGMQRREEVRGTMRGRSETVLSLSVNITVGGTEETFRINGHR